ncbi:HTH domain-containing protein [Sporosarcina sp. MB25]|nr:HTH domain-containing protein [Sporosarcina cyprini]
MMKSRQIEMLLYLLKVKKTTHEELAKKFEVSIKTIQRDIDTLSVMGIPVTCKKGNQGGILIDEKYKLSRTLLTNEDLQSIVFALSLYDSVSKRNHGEEILKKLALISPDMIYLLAKDANEYFVVDLFKEKLDLSGMVYEHINACLDEEYLLDITVGSERMKVAPISYVLRADGLYLYAFAEEYVLIKVSDILYSKVTGEEFERNFLQYEENQNIIVK